MPHTCSRCGQSHEEVVAKNDTPKDPRCPHGHDWLDYEERLHNWLAFTFADVDRIRRWCDEYGGSLEDVHRFVVVEQNTLPGASETLVHSFDTEDEAAEYIGDLIARSETADWQPTNVLDLNTMTELEWDVTGKLTRTSLKEDRP